MNLLRLKSFAISHRINMCAPSSYAFLTPFTIHPKN